MAISIDDVRHIATLARLGLSDERASAVVSELNTILEHMDVLARVDTEGVEEAVGAGTRGAPLRNDSGPPLPLARALLAFAPMVSEGFLLVPRLASHES
jgi:aspartyl-tRNA(Asn)/glutamyl-tRNA(Gln) amidotransferase subunit C